MNVLAYMKDKCLLLLLHVASMAALGVFLRLTGYPMAGVALILIFWALILGIWLSATYISRKKYFGAIEKILGQIDQRHLLGELLPLSVSLEDRLYRRYFRLSNKGAIEQIRRIEEERKEYREYIEGWVHEIKAPITGIASICENARKEGILGHGTEGARETEMQGKYRFSGAWDALSGPTGEPAMQGAEGRESAWAEPDRWKEILRTISMENRKIENYVDMALYYARSGEVYKDYFIQKTDLQEVAAEVLAKNRLLFIQNHVSASIDCRDFVYTDRKWIGFILEQMALNSVKYCSRSPVFSMYTKRGKDGVVFIFEDNGAGIPEEELSRIFEKGFTGSNGRARGQATGMGLYLCKKLCGRLGVGISAESVLGEGTRMALTFPVSSYIVPPKDAT